jgi:hypothetical protein
MDGACSKRGREEIIILGRSRHRKLETLKWILNERVGRCELNSPDSEQIQVAGSCEHGHKIPSSIKCW